MPLFNAFSAWFSPELAEYQETWVQHGGLIKELEEADIAFVSDESSSGTGRVKPTMKILRPDWIEDSVKGGKRLSVVRYKTTFPALQRLDSASLPGHMAVGMEAFTSSNVMSLDPPSVQAHQPEPEIPDLSVNEHLTASTLLPRRSRSPSRNSIQSQEWDEEVEHLVELARRSVSIDVEAFWPESEPQTQLRPEIEPEQEPEPQPEPQSEPQPDPEPEPVNTSKKRRLPDTLCRNNRPPPAVRDVQPSGDFFGSSDSEDERAPSQRASPSLNSVETEPMPQATQSSLVSESPSQQLSSQDRRAETASRQHAEVYLERAVALMDPTPRRLFTGVDPSMHTIDIASTNIELRRKSKGKRRKE